MNRPQETSDDIGYDSEVNALLADLDVSIASFDERMEQRRHEEHHAARPAAKANSYPIVDPDAVFCRVTKPSSPIAPEERQSSAQPGDLLSQLRTEVDSLSQTNRHSGLSETIQRQRFSTSLRLAFDYFHELTQHLNALRPDLPCSYTLGSGAEFIKPKWQKGNAHAKSPANNEFHLIESVVVRGTCTAANDLAIACPRHQASTLRHEMALLNIHIVDEDDRSDAARVRFVLSREIRIQLHLSSSFETDSILVHARNVGGLGLAAYTASPEQLDRESFNMLGEQILGRRRSPPPAFKPIPFSQGLGKR